MNILTSINKFLILEGSKGVYNKHYTISRLGICGGGGGGGTKIWGSSLILLPPWTWWMWSSNSTCNRYNQYNETLPVTGIINKQTPPVTGIINNQTPPVTGEHLHRINADRLTIYYRGFTEMSEYMETDAHQTVDFQ